MWKPSAHLRQGLALLQTLPETPERLRATWTCTLPSAHRCLPRKATRLLKLRDVHDARQLCRTPGRPAPAFPRVTWTVELLFVRAELQTAHALGEQLLTLAQQIQDAAMLVAAHRALGATLFYLGAGAAAHHALYPGDSPLRPPAAPRLCVPLWGRRWCGLPQLCCLDAVVSWLS